MFNYCPVDGCSSTASLPSHGAAASLSVRQTNFSHDTEEISARRSTAEHAIHGACWVWESLPPLAMRCREASKDGRGAARMLAGDPDEGTFK
jgi:hypothetical protein